MEVEVEAVLSAISKVVEEVEEVKAGLTNLRT